MIGTAQSAQGRSRASRAWFAAMVIGVFALGLGVAPALAADPGTSDHVALAKKKDGLSEKAGTLVDTAKKKDGALDKGATPSELKAGDLDGIKTPEIKTADERKKP